MLTYIRFISAAEPCGQSLDGRGAPPLALPDKRRRPEPRPTGLHRRPAPSAMAPTARDSAWIRRRPRQAGRRYRFPPLWGPDSFNDGAGMARAITAARFVHANMPFGTTFEAPALSVADAFDVTAYHQRPAAAA